MADEQSSSISFYSPETLVELALRYRELGNIGIAFTYNEPLIGYEYVAETSVLARHNGLETVLVTNGYINEDPLLELLPNISALNIDLKSFSPEFYSRIKGDLDTVKRSIEIASRLANVEVTTLIVPGENDTDEEMRNLAKWLASVDSEIPYHITAFYPRYKMTDRGRTREETIRRLANIASQYLRYVYA